MAQFPAAFSCHAARPSWTRSPVRWTAKSTIVVVPPHAAARVPVSKVSEANVPPNGSSMCVCTSIPPGTTYFPVASITFSNVGAASVKNPRAPTAAIVSPSIITSVSARPVAETIVPFSIRIRLIGTSSPRHDVVVRIGATVSVERPPVAHLADLRQVEVAHEELGLVRVAHLADELTLRVHEVTLPVEVVVAERF